MKHARDDYDRIQDPAGFIPSDEPVFLLRAQDALAAEVVRFYAWRCRHAGVHDIAALVEGHANLMDQWPKKKLPDLPAPPSAACIDCGALFSAIPSTVSQPATRCSLPECADGCTKHVSECQSPDPLSETIAVPPHERT